MQSNQTSSSQKLQIINPQRILIQSNQIKTKQKWVWFEEKMRKRLWSNQQWSENHPKEIVWDYWDIPKLKKQMQLIDSMKNKLQRWHQPNIRLLGWIKSNQINERSKTEKEKEESNKPTQAKIISRQTTFPKTITIQKNQSIKAIDLFKSVGKWKANRLRDSSKLWNLWFISHQNTTHPWNCHRTWRQ